MLRSTTVLTGGDVDSREREREKEREREREREQSAEINYSTHGWRCRLKRER